MVDRSIDVRPQTEPSLGPIQVRFAAALMTTTLGVLLAACAFTLSAGSERWLALGVGAAGLLVVLIAFAAPRRGAVQRMLDPFLALTCAWAIVFARVVATTGAGSSAHSVKWWEFACGAAIGGIGGIGLLLHEAGVIRDLRHSTDTVVVTYSVPEQPRPTRNGHPISSPVSTRRGGE